LVLGAFALGVSAQSAVEVSDDGLESVMLRPQDESREREEIPEGRSTTAVIYSATPDWSNNLRVQVGGLAVADVNGDSYEDVVVGCYISNSYPPYDDWRNFIYLNTGGTLEATPSWASDDSRSTGDIHVALINDDAFPDIVAGNGGSSPSVIYFGTATGPSTTPGWLSADNAWTSYALPFDLDHDGDTDLITANQGLSQYDPYRPMYAFINNAGTLETTPSWQSAETSIQNFLAFGDLDGDGWEDLAVSKWSGFESGVYRNVDGVLETTPTWTTGSTSSDKGVAWADVDGNKWVDLAIGRSPTTVYENDAGTLTQAWVSTASYFGHSDLAFCDVDLDGDPDLAEVHFSNGVVNLYLNEKGALSATPSWSYDSAAVGTALAFGLINNDLYPDLVVGNSGDPSVMVFINERVFEDGFESGDLSAWSESVP
jgi:hypothetical protein